MHIITVTAKVSEAGITRENKKEKEAYRLEIKPEGVTVCAAEKEGLFNGVQTLNSKMAGSPSIWIFTTMAGELTSH